MRERDRWVQEMLITNAIHAIPEWLVVLIAGKSGRCKVRKRHTELRVRKSICKINQQLFDHRLHLGGGLEHHSDCAVREHSTANWLPKSRLFPPDAVVPYG